MKIEAESGVTNKSALTAPAVPPPTEKPRRRRNGRNSIPKKMRHGMTPAQRSLLAVARDHPRLHGRIAWLQWIGRDLVDLVCHDARLVIEIESEPPPADTVRAALDARLRAFGYRVLRIGNREVLSHVHAAVERIARPGDPLLAVAHGQERP